jgi:hypothetical protein
MAQIRFYSLVCFMAGGLFAADERLPSPGEVIEVFRDQIGRTQFAPTNITGWREIAVWRRVDVFMFPPGVEDSTATPTFQDPPLFKRLRVLERKNGANTEYAVMEIIENMPSLSNLFPVMRGTPDGFVFYNHVTEMGEFEETCRTIRDRGREFLACRTIRPDGGFHYQRFVSESP